MTAQKHLKNHFFHSNILPWVICSIGTLFYCYNYFLRVSPSTMQGDLMQNLHITAYQFGNLSAFYYFSYTPMQIPVGMLYDRYGAKLVMFCACLVAISGLFLFVNANSINTIYAGRFLIGLGTAFSYIGVLKLASLWLPANRFATVAGLTTAFGMGTAILAVDYLTHLVDVIGYKNALYSSLVTGVLLSIIILVFMKNSPKEDYLQPGNHPAPLSFAELLEALKIVLTSSQTWLIGIIGCLFYLPASVLLDLWGIPYLNTAYGLSAQTAASLVSMTFLGWIIAGPTIGLLSDKIKRRRLPLQISAIMATVLICIVFYVPNLNLTELYVLFLLIGVFCGAHPLCFALGKENTPSAFSGTGIAVTNTLIMSGGLIFQPLVGKLLDWHSLATQLNQGEVVYTLSDYNYALSIIPLGLLVAIALSYLLKETYCQSLEEAQVAEARPTAQIYQFPSLSPKT